MLKELPHIALPEKTKPKRGFRLERSQDIPSPPEDVFAYFADARNLQVITPPFLHFRILTPLPIQLRRGATLEYSLRLYGCPVYWQTLIETWEPCRRFVDVQQAGPYRRWHHTHEFTAISGGTRMVDVVEYEIAWGPFGALAQKLFVAQALDRIFDYRRDVVAKIFSAMEV